MCRLDLMTSLQLDRLNVDRLAGMSLRAVLLAHHLADEPSFRAQKFPSEASTATSGLRLEDRLLQFSLGKKLLVTGVLPLQLGHQLGFLSLHTVALLPPARIGRLGHLDGAANAGDDLALCHQPTS